MVAVPLSNFDGEVLHEQELTLLGDGAQTIDLLGYQPYVDALVEVLAQERLQTPFAVGVFGRRYFTSSTQLLPGFSQVSFTMGRSAT